MITPNPWRGEVAITLGGKNYILRPTFAALSAIEQTLGQGLVALAGKLANGAITLEELSAIIAQCVIGDNPDIRELLVRGGVSEAVQSVSLMFAAVFGGYDEAE
jgi:hypothetical protein